jgi:hypothetical protein
MGGAEQQYNQVYMAQVCMCVVYECVYVSVPHLYIHICMCVSRVCMFCYVYYANMVCEYMAQALSPNNYAATGRNSQKSASHYPFDMNDDR